MPSILLVEDDDQLRAMLKLLLTSSGYEVWETCTGKEVGYMYHHPDLVITDLLMPEKDGLEVIMELRRKDSSVKIIAMSGGGQWSPECYLLLAQKLGARITLSKPFGSEELLRTVHSALEPDA